MKAVGVHGFKVRDNGAGTIGRLDGPLRALGFEIDSDEGDYGYFGLLDIRLRNGKRRRAVLERMAKAISTADLVYTHSNGSHFTRSAMRLLPMDVQQRIVVVNISAAENRKTEPTLATRAELNLCTPYDGWVRASSWLPFSHPWGRRGARGYSGESERVWDEFHPAVRDHSDWFKPKHIELTVERIWRFWSIHS